MIYIYILKLEQNKFYVGKTNNPDFRIENHINGEGSAWTKKYKPIQLIELLSNCDDYDEDKYTRMYMDKMGVDNVRGGSYVQITLDDNTLNHLKKMSISTNNKCFNCGESGHFVKFCPNKTYNNNISNEPILINKFNKGCERCGRQNHNKKHCYAKKDINGNYIQDNDCLRCGRRCITELCNKTYDIKGNIIEDNNYVYNFQCSHCNSNQHNLYNCSKFQQEQYELAEIARKNNVCSRCKRIGHYRINCYETQDIHGNSINSIDSCIIS